MDIPTPETMEQILDEIDSVIESGKPVYVHCLGGIGRTGTVVGCYLLRHGSATRGNVLEKIQDLRENDPNLYRDSPETAIQRHFVLYWREQISL
jgi:protein-tyrosine phosphatase